MKNLIICVFLQLVLISVQAQPDNRVFTVQHNIPYQKLTTPTIVTSVDWDDFDAVIPLGFPFTLLGKTSSHLYFTFDYGVGSTMQMDLGNNNAFNEFGWYADIQDLHNDNPNLHSTIGYKNDIVSGKKVCKIEWNNVGFLEGVSPLDSANLQTWVYEDRNIIEVRFGKSSRDHITTFFNDANFGLGLKGPLFGFIKDNDPDNNTLTKLYYVANDITPKMDSATAADITNNTSTIGVDSFPVANTLYRWAPATGTGFNSVLLNENIQLFPTLVETDLFITMKESVPYRASIFNLQGQLVYTADLKTSKEKLNLSAFKTGNYILRLSNQREQISYQFSKR
jgi:Secretion system C-terminal sorting domain